MAYTDSVSATVVTAGAATVLFSKSVGRSDESRERDGGVKSVTIFVLEEELSKFGNVNGMVGFQPTTVRAIHASASDKSHSGTHCRRDWALWCEGRAMCRCYSVDEWSDRRLGRAAVSWALRVLGLPYPTFEARVRSCNLRVVLQREPQFIVKAYMPKY